MLSAEVPAGAVAVVGHVLFDPEGLPVVGLVLKLRLVSGWKGLLSCAELWSRGVLQSSSYEVGMAVKENR